MTANKTKLIGDVAEFAEISTQIDELRGKLRSLVGTTSTGVVENTDNYLAKAIDALEDYFEWAGCYDDEPEVKALSRESIDEYHEDLLRRIRESDEPIPVRGIFHKPEKISKIEKYTVIVCEEDYKFSIGRVYDGYPTSRKTEILNDAANPNESFIWFEDWIVKDGDDSLYDNLHSLVGRETRVMTKTLIVEGDF